MNRCLICLLLFSPAIANAQGFSPEEAVKRMKVPDGFTVKLVACEPMIRQPLSISFDERGRMWVLQYLQYPNPAGLKPVKQDQYLRTIWDRIPEPPPKGPKGADRITICFDPDENGRYRKSKDFVAGLNLATGFCIGGGGVFVVQPPYLLFYPDKDHDDVPDGDPEVCLSGFGMEDSHSYANSLQWGPDGWLYGAHGSTVSAKIINPAKPNDAPLEFQQGIWRYHPKTKEFELFSEGGGNTYGLDFDKYGRAIAGTNYGGRAMLHQLQGAYYVKGFSKHGPLHNPHTYGYFDHVPYPDFKGGHVTCGGIVYQADAYPKEYRDQYIAGNLLSNSVYWHKMTEQGSSFTARHGGDFLVANDTWFRVVDCFQGPDGSVHIADWYDKRAAHLDPVDNWDKTNGRIYKVEYKGTKPVGDFDLRKQSVEDWVELLKHPNKWWRNEARRLLAEKRTEKAVALLRRGAMQQADPLLALESLWALASCQSLPEDFAAKLLSHPSEHVRTWAIRLLGDRRSISAVVRSQFIDLARHDPSVIVRSQLACSAKRLPGEDALPIVMALLFRSEDVADPFMPLLNWWVIEDKAISHASLLRELMEQEGKRGFWSLPLVQSMLLERIGRRYLAEGTPTAYQGCTDLLNMIPDKSQVVLLVKGMNLAIEGRRIDKITPALEKAFLTRWAEQPNNEDFLKLAIRLKNADAYDRVLKESQNAQASDAQRMKMFGLLAETGKPEVVAVFQKIFHEGKSDAIRLAALNALQRFPDPKIGEDVLAAFPKLTGGVRQQAQAFLLSRPATALALLQQVDRGVIQVKEISVDQVRPLHEFKNSTISKLIDKHWGKVGPVTPGEKQARISWLNIALSRGTGEKAKGKEIFTKTCMACHTLFGEGGKVGPDLTTADRKNRGYMLTHIVDPSLYIRPEFVQFNVAMLDGRKLQGLVSETVGESITLVNVIENKPMKTNIAKKDIEEMLPSPVSLMPEKVLDTMSDQDVRDLFAFLQADPPAKKEQPSNSGTKKLKVLLISGSLEYKSDETLAEYQKYLEANYPVQCVRAFRKTDTDLPGLENLDTCDVAVFFTRRLQIDGEQLERIKKYATSGKPIVGIRTASHGFQKWLNMDKEVLGGNYQNHYGQGLKCEVSIVESGKDHPVLKGVKPFSTNGGLYKNPDISKDVTVLLTGSIPEHTEPIAWVREYKGGRIFYTSLGHPDDFKNANFVQMITNAIFWTTKSELQKK
jgi:putative membrane-bound dehydrogenase-like protein